ncbi:hypothetical protein NDI43_14835 [Microcoleus vaginatus GB2-A3]|uniref:hypothetical protein n=1 Tax=Microcoleus vaginatus TaxID=119532 RepID=UPI0032A2769D
MYRQIWVLQALLESHVELTGYPICNSYQFSDSPSTVNRQQSTVNSQPSTVNRQQSTVNSQPSTVNRQPSTVSVESSFLPSSYPCF